MSKNFFLSMFATFVVLISYFGGFIQGYFYSPYSPTSYIHAESGSIINFSGTGLLNSGLE